MSYGFQIFFFCLACFWPELGAESNLRMVNQWAEMEFVFPDEETKQIAMTKQHYVPGKSIPIDVDVQYRKDSLSPRIFVTTTRFSEGRPVTLGTVDEKGKISGYPDYSWHENQGQNCEGITSVYRTAVVDVTPGDCGDTYVYVADVAAYALVVVDVARNRSWRLTHRLFYPFPTRAKVTVDGESFDLMDGVLGMALSPWRRNPDRFLYFHAFASTTENVVRTSVLKNDSFLADPNVDPKLIRVFPDERPNQAVAEAMDRKGIMYFGLMDPPSIWCWNSATEYNQRNFHQVAEDRETLQFASGVKVINNLKRKQELWVLTSSFQRVMTESLSSNRTNFRIHAGKIPVILAKSPCLFPPKNRRHDYYANIIGAPAE
ncbi:protein yellow-like isoform X2 [Hyposmocoma kahamanoa]|uniref:protein yellow-like isoform X2 n=1 Tax=Hyposmocoma kahamanoa TaxID=1477025 RepID=UPI000E6D5D11|nr:protein yellow-like isoform X2 [Hyposmocoma kahamanoa]